MYIGRYYHRLDAKGRVSLPKEFREQVMDGAIITRGLDGCLSIYDKSTWEKKLQTLDALTDTKRAHREYVRYLTNDAMKIAVDALGRIRIERFLIDCARLSTRVVFVGSLDRIELWDETVYREYADSVADRITDTIEGIES